MAISLFKRSIQLDTYSCGVHSVAMIVHHFGDKTPFATLKRELRCTPDKGTSVKAMIDAFRTRELGVAHLSNMRFSELRSWLDKGRLVLVHLDGDHFGVVHGYDAEWVYLADPSLLRLLGTKMSHKAFRKRWTNWGLAVKPW